MQHSVREERREEDFHVIFLDLFSGSKTIAAFLRICLCGNFTVLLELTPALSRAGLQSTARMIGSIFETVMAGASLNLTFKMQ